MREVNHLSMREAGRYLGQSYRWMQRHWIDLIRGGVDAYRVPKDAEKGRLIFKKESLDEYLEACRVNPCKKLTAE